MRLIDADELMEHVNRDRLDSRELIEQMIRNAPIVRVKATEEEQEKLKIALDCEMERNHALISRLGVYEDVFMMIIKLLLDRATKN